MKKLMKQLIALTKYGPVDVNISDEWGKFEIHLPKQDESNEIKEVYDIDNTSMHKSCIKSYTFGADIPIANRLNIGNYYDTPDGWYTLVHVDSKACMCTLIKSVADNDTPKDINYYDATHYVSMVLSNKFKNADFPPVKVEMARFNTIYDNPISCSVYHDISGDPLNYWLNYEIIFGGQQKGLMYVNEKGEVCYNDPQIKMALRPQIIIESAALSQLAGYGKI